jgi:hypothetical protein
MLCLLFVADELPGTLITTVSAYDLDADRQLEITFGTNIHAYQSGQELTDRSQFVVRIFMLILVSLYLWHQHSCIPVQAGAHLSHSICGKDRCYFDVVWLYLCYQQELTECNQFVIVILIVVVRAEFSGKTKNQNVMIMIMTQSIFVCGQDLFAISLDGRVTVNKPLDRDRVDFMTYELVVTDVRPTSRQNGTGWQRNVTVITVEYFYDNCQTCCFPDKICLKEQRSTVVKRL